MIDKDLCNMPNCENEATKIAATESSYIVICEDCWHKKYKC